MADLTNKATKKEITKLNLGGLGVGLMQWGTTNIDDKFVNPKGNLSDDQVRELWKCCHDELNITFFDTAEGYGGGTSELRIRQVRGWHRALHSDGDDNSTKKISKPIIATKCLPTLWRWTKGSFYKSLKHSMERLGVDTIDLYFIHTPIHPLPIEYFIQWACDAVDDGLIEHIGISNCNAELAKRADAVAKRNGKRIACNQIMLNLLVWQSEKHRETVKVCQELGIDIVAYSPIGQGLLTDQLTETKYKSIRATRMTGVSYDSLQPLRAEVYRLSQEHNCTMAQVAINWVRSHSNPETNFHVVPLIGCRKLEQLKDAHQSLSWSLSKEEMESLNGLTLGRSMFEKPWYRRCLFVVFISILQMAYYTEQHYIRLKKVWNSSGMAIKADAHEE